MMKNLAVWRFGRVEAHILDQPAMVDPRMWLNIHHCHHHCYHHHHHHLGSWSDRRGHCVSKSVTRLLKKLLGSFRNLFCHNLLSFLVHCYPVNRLPGIFTWMMKRYLEYAWKGAIFPLHLIWSTTKSVSAYHRQRMFAFKHFRFNFHHSKCSSDYVAYLTSLTVKQVFSECLHNNW